MTASFVIANVHTAIADQLRTSFASTWDVSAWPVDQPHPPQMALVPDDPWLSEPLAFDRGAVSASLVLHLTVSGAELDGGLALLASVLSWYPNGHASYSSTLWGVLRANKTAICTAGGFSELAWVKPTTVNGSQDGEVRLLTASVPLIAYGQVVA